MSITIQNDFAKLLAGLDAMKDKAMDGALAGLKDAADDATGRMRATEAHGDKTGATRANYRAFAVGHGETGSDALGQSIAVVNEKNPGHVATASVDLEAAIGVIYTSVTNYQRKLETEAAGARAVIGPTVQATASDMTRAAAAGSKKALS